MSYKVTISLHSNIPNKNDHLDCFIDPGENEKLLTYELDSTFLKNLEKKTTISEILLVEIMPTNILIQSNCTVFATKKRDHRRMYLRFSGKISKNGGFLEVIAQGTINTLPEKNNIFLHLNLENSLKN